MMATRRRKLNNNDSSDSSEEPSCDDSSDSDCDDDSDDNDDSSDLSDSDSSDASDPVPSDCGSSDYPKEIYDPITWRFLQDAYLETTPNSEIYELQNAVHPSYSGFRVAIEVRQDRTSGIGRRVYANEPISKGTAIWEPIHRVGFTNRDELLGFLGQLDHDLQCDVLLLARPDRTTPDTVSLALDPSSFVNFGPTKKKSNLEVMFVATRDIATGEELLLEKNKYVTYWNTTTHRESGGGLKTASTSMRWFYQMRKRAWDNEKEITIDLSLGEGIDESEIHQLLILLVGIILLASKRYLPSCPGTTDSSSAPVSSPRNGRKTFR